MTYRAWNLKTLDRAAVRELTHAIAEQNTEELEYHSQSEEPWTEAQYNATLAAQQKETALLAGILAARGITDPTEALTLLAGEEELTDPMLLNDMDKACARILQAIDNEETIVVFGDYDVDGVTATALLYQHLKGMGANVKCMLPSREFKKSVNLKEVAKNVPLDRLMIETDSPYLAPEPVRGHRNEPLNVGHICRLIAALRQMDAQQLCDITRENGRRFYGIG